jgi:hypothetical protein
MKNTSVIHSVVTAMTAPLECPARRLLDGNGSGDPDWTKVDQKVFISERAVRYLGASQNATNSAQHSGGAGGHGGRHAVRCI